MDEISKNSLALHVKDVHKSYGTRRGAYHVLRAFTMEVPYGTTWVNAEYYLISRVLSVVAHLFITTLKVLKKAN